MTLLFLKNILIFTPWGFLYLNINSEQWRIIPNNILNINIFLGVSLSKYL
jgi:hypothetical protein